ncbi:MAG: sigma-70 family RNA polymerase sigma factor [Acidobacteria bacterium]|nr:sigma-70 family RNA polymerase sigma factor [Acidobacteriota bacterium]
MRQLNTTWALTEEAFRQLLSRLDTDPMRAGTAYETLRESLVKFLDWRGAHAPEDLVDEAFNRVARKLEEGEPIQDVPSYCHGVARLVFLQSLERPEQRHVALEEALPVAAPEPEAETPDACAECLRHCLQTLPPESRSLITAYYRDERRQKIDNRAALAERLNIPLNALRSRAYRFIGECSRRSNPGCKAACSSASACVALRSAFRASWPNARALSAPIHSMGTASPSYLA